MSDINLQAAVVEAIGESDAEIGGRMSTIVSSRHVYGQDNALTSSPNTLTSLTDVFDPSITGALIDILDGSGATGSYVATYVDARNVTLAYYDASWPSFSSATGVRWRRADICVESVFGLEVIKGCGVYLLGEEKIIPFLSLDTTPGAQRIKEIGTAAFYEDGIISTSDPTHFVADRLGAFSSSDVGKEIRILSGPHVGTRHIVTVVDEKTVVLSGPTFTWGGGVNVQWAMKDYSSGYMTIDHRGGDEVVDGGRSSSALDKVRRALLIDYAEGVDIDRIGRRYGVYRPRSLGDSAFRRIVRTMAYMARQTVAALEDVLTALFPGGGWTIYEDLVNHPNEVFIDIPTMQAGSSYEGRAFLNVEDDATSSSTTSVTVSEAPTKTEIVRKAVTNHLTIFDVLPSSATPPWTYVNEGDTEATAMSLPGGDVLAMRLYNLTGGATGGHYELSVPEINPLKWSMSVWFGTPVYSSIGGYPFKMVVNDGDREICFMWGAHYMILGQSDGTHVASASIVMVDQKGRFLVERDGDDVVAKRNGVEVIREKASSFSASSSRSFAFGYWDCGFGQDSTSYWEHVRVASSPSRNFLNVVKSDGSLSMGGSTLTSSSSPFAGGDTGRHVRIYSDHNLNDGLWLATYASATTLALNGITRTECSVSGKTTSTTDATIYSPNGRFSSRDIGKSINVAWSSLGNNGDYLITRVVSRDVVVVSNSTGFASESGLATSLNANFASETSVSWELVDRGYSSGNVITTADALPSATTKTTCDYTTIPSSQMLFDESVENTGVAPHEFHPIYLFDVDASTRMIVEDVTAAGVIPKFRRP